MEVYYLKQKNSFDDTVEKYESKLFYEYTFSKVILNNGYELKLNLSFSENEKLDITDNNESDLFIPSVLEYEEAINENNNFIKEIFILLNQNNITSFLDLREFTKNLSINGSMKINENISLTKNLTNASTQFIKDNLE